VCGRGYSAGDAGRGLETDLELTNVLTLQDGRVQHQEFFWDHAAALEALGLSE
jgi:ketosteroid isomerase-like protein